MAKEIFVIYNRITGFIEGGAGCIDRDWDSGNADGSTMSERIVDILAKDLDRDVLYLSDQSVPDAGKHKIIGGEIVDLTQKDKDDIEIARPKEQVELLEARVSALELVPAQI